MSDQSISQPVSDLDDLARQYGESYYLTGFGSVPYDRNAHWLNFFGGIANELIRSLAPKNVFDAGCAMGMLVEAFWDRGVTAHGVDISPFAIGRVRGDMRQYCAVGSITEPVQGRYDLITCLEVVEHLPVEHARTAVKQLTRATDAILFSSTPSDLTEPTHVNVQPVIYWLRLLAELGFLPDVRYDASFVAPHAFLVRRGHQNGSDEVLTLFSETLRQRANHSLFLSRHGRIEALEEEARVLREEVAEQTARRAEYESEVNQLAAQCTAFAAEKERWLKEQADSQRAREESAGAERTIAELRIRLDDAEERLAWVRDSVHTWIPDMEASGASRATPAERSGRVYPDGSEGQADEWLTRVSEFSEYSAALAAERDVLKADLDSIYRSPGWQFILRYRNWLQSNRWRKRWVRRTWEPAAKWLLQRAHLNSAGGGSSVPAAPIIPTPRAIPAAVDAPKADSASSVAEPAGVHTPTPSSSGDSDSYQTWIAENEPTHEQLEIQRRLGACFSFRPTISVIVPVYKVPLEVFRAAVESVRAQTYDNWELCIAIPEQDNPQACEYAAKVALEDARIRVRRLDKNEGISGNSNQALTLATGAFIALLDHDDVLAPFAFFEVVRLLNEGGPVNFIYSDKDQITQDGSRRFQPLFKPEWSPELMLSANYLTHLSVMRTEQVREIGGWRTVTDGAQDWDLFLRIIRRYGSVRHIPKVLYHWRHIATSVAAGGIGAKPYAERAQVQAVQDHCDAVGIKAKLVSDPAMGLWLEWPKQEARVSVVCLSQTPSLATFESAAKLREATKHASFEILVPLSGAVPAEAGRLHDPSVRVIPSGTRASLEEQIEEALRHATGEILVFFDESVTPATANWLDELTAPLGIPDVGLVGARLVEAESHRLRHCGLVITEAGRVESVYAGQPQHVYEAFGGAQWFRDWSAVSGACIAIRRERWAAIGGLSGRIGTLRPDVFLSLKVQQGGKHRVLYTPQALLYQRGVAALESGSEGDTERAYLQAAFPDGDPYFNPNVHCRGGLVTFARGRAEQSRSTDYSAESRILAQVYDCVPEQVERSRLASTKKRTGQLQSITWFLPEFSNPFYGGIHTILRFADRFAAQHGIQNRFCILGHGSPDRFAKTTAAAFPALAAASKFFVLDSHARVNDLPASDAAICTLWTTAYAALEFEKVRQKFYFLQDDEALFYPAGSTSSLVEATNRFGFHGVCNTVSILRAYEARGGSGEYFVPQIDPTVFQSDGRATDSVDRPLTLFCYARPGHPRNCFEIVAAALRIVKERLGDRFLVLTAGADWDPAEHGLDGIVQQLGLLHYRTTGALYRMCDAGLVMMMTRHPSYLPLELMASGALVITNRNPDTAWLLRDEENCLLAEPTPGSLAARIEKGLMDRKSHRRITATAEQLTAAQYCNWEQQIDRIHRYILGLC